MYDDKESKSFLVKQKWNFGALSIVDNIFFWQKALLITYDQLLFGLAMTFTIFVVDLIEV